VATPQTQRESYSILPDFLAVFKGLLLQDGKDGKGEEGKEGEGK